ncbi:hypothetical protein LTR62_008761 [Meristemomyces frigidus]|uniref:Rhodopsin domain-containing protein n=1 Tax=Meristemomyces frigidus TaxID=1508187 RepID=A0AAN7T950_9PEZI|nr:hypothetical protein LTR62_008761 [Meristemomyces frigidus]
MAYAIINILTDAIVIALPIPEVLQLKLNTRQKVMLCGVFLLGIFVSLCSVLRIIAVLKDDKGKDTTWDFIPRNIWSFVETNVGIICACLPVLKTPIFRGLSFVLGTKRASGREYGSPHELDSGATKGHKRGPSKDQWDDTINDRASDEVHMVDRGELDDASQRAFVLPKQRP